MLRESSTIASVSATAYAGPCSLSLGCTYQFAYSYTCAVRGRFTKLSSGDEVYAPWHAAQSGPVAG